jgi:hypothetical protein
LLTALIAAMPPDMMAAMRGAQQSPPDAAMLPRHFSWLSLPD